MFFKSLAFISILSSLALAAPVLDIEKRATGVQIHPGNDATYCMAPNVAPANGVGLVTIQCSQVQTTNPNAPYYSLWDITPGDQLSLKLSGTNFCLDAGENPTSGTGSIKIWQCYPGVVQQRWFYTDDQHIAITGGNTCLTFGRYGTYTQGCGLAVQQGQQAWTFGTGGSNPPPTNPPPTNPPPTTGGRQIYWNGDKTKCLTVANGAFANGQGVNINTCFGASDPNIQFQLWNINKGAGTVKVNGQNYCLDAGNNPGNGVVGKIWTCISGIAAQNWYYTDDNHIAVTGGTTCLDVRAESGPGQAKPYGSLKDVQQWQCSGNNGNQIFTL